MNYYNEIKNKIIDNETYIKVKDYSNKLVVEFGKKYNVRTLRHIRQYYRVFKNEKWSPMATKLSWSHYSKLLKIIHIKILKKVMYK